MNATDSPEEAPARAVWLIDAADLTDLATFVGRAKRVDPDGAIRLVGHGEVLAAYVSPVHGGGGPTVLGLRVLRLARPADLDLTVALAAFSDRFARRADLLVPGTDPTPGQVRLGVPPADAAGVAWAGTSPPRAGWEPVVAMPAAVVRDAAAAGVAEIAAGVPDVAGAAAVAALRGRVWGRPLVSDVPDLPAGAAFAADALGFIEGDAPVAVHRSGPWWRLTTDRGYVLARRPLLG